MHVIGTSDSEDEPWCFALFSGADKIHSFIVVGILYPFFTSWVLLGTLWYAEVDAQARATKGAECFHDQQQSWYFVLWLVIFYIWVIAYTTAITISALMYYRQRDFETQYMRLLEQYEGNALPSAPVYQMNGLSPHSIHTLPVQEIRTPQQGELTCSICLEEVQKGEKIRLMPCGHRYHLPCIDSWLLRKGYCPICKRNLRRDEMEEPLLPL